MSGPMRIGPELLTPGADQFASHLHDTRLIGHTVDAELDATLWRLVGGDLTLSDVTFALRDWWAVAAEFGRQTANTDRIERLEWERDYWYYRANGGSHYYAHATNRLWEEAGRTGDYSEWREAVAA